MSGHGTLHYRRTRRRRRGQGMTEYIILVAMAMLAMVGLMGLFLDGVGDFYKNVQYVVCTPFP